MARNTFWNAWPFGHNAETGNESREVIITEAGFLVFNDDADLVQRCLAGDEDSRSRFVERYQGLVFGLCFRLLGHREDAEDTAQEVFLRAFRSLHRWDSERPVKPWLLSIAVNRCRTAMARRAKKARHSAVPVESIRDTTPTGTSDLAEELQLALDSLRTNYRTCFVLFYQQELNCAEISEVLNRPEGTIKTWLHRARHELADFLKRRGIVPKGYHEVHRI